MISSNQTYNADFSNYYDRITEHKDYRAEIDALVNFIRHTVGHRQLRILDVGCGTGHHAALLAEQGYDLTAIDLSPDMIRIATSHHRNVKFRCGDIAELPETDFHFSYSLFNVINCLDSLEAVISFFKGVSSRLLQGGVFLVEGWNPIAVIASPPEIVERTYEYQNERIVRKVVPACDFLNQRLDLQYYIDVYRPNGNHEKLKSFTVVHHLILFTPLEVEYCLKQAGFEKIKTYTALPDLNEATASDRMLAFVCEK